MRWWEIGFSWDEARLGVALGRLKQLGLRACRFDGEADGRLRLRAFLPTSTPRAVVLGLAYHLEADSRRLDAPPPAVRFRQTDTCDAPASWQPTPIGRRILLQPAAEPVPAANGRVVVRLLPRAAFGSLHATTVLCLEALEDRPLRGATIADLGCGSGVLGLAAVRLGAARVHAVDVDAVAVETTRENRELNTVDPDALTVVAGSVEAIPEGVDGVVCNTLTPILEAVVPRLRRVVGPRGRVLLCGIREEEQPRIEAICGEHGLGIETWRARDGWRLAEARLEEHA